MKDYYLVATLAAALLVSGVFLYKKDVIGRSRPISSSDVLNIENAIIIEGIEMESKIPMADEVPGEGQIIFVDGFVDTTHENDVAVTKNKVNSSDEEAGDILKSLREKDSRWHLSRYRIRKNDNLWNIARRFGATSGDIIRINRIKNPDMLLPGKYLDIPNRMGTYYTIKNGDNLSTISRRYGVPVEKIAGHNKIPKNRIVAGNKIFIPDAVKQAPVTRKKSVVHKKTNSEKAGFAITWPLRGKITSGFGNRKDPFSGKRSFHCGIDISADIGKKVLAAADGRVIFSGWKKGYGKVVIIRHQGGYITVYAHNNKNIVKNQEQVKRGATIALSGNTGAVTGAHLHFELRKYLTPLNPMRFLK